MANSSLVIYDPQAADPAMITGAGYLACYTGRTGEAYTLDIRQCVEWCAIHDLPILEVRCTHIELYARELEARGRARATVSRRLSTGSGLFRFAAEEGVIEASPAAHVRRSRLDYESHAVGPDRNELGAFLVAAGLSSHAIIALLAARAKWAPLL